MMCLIFHNNYGLNYNVFDLSFILLLNFVNKQFAIHFSIQQGIIVSDFLQF